MEDDDWRDDDCGKRRHGDQTWADTHGGRYALGLMVLLNGGYGVCEF